MIQLRTFAMLAFAALLFVACSDDDNGTTPPTTQNPTFTSTNVKDGAVYFSFDDDREAPQWDVKFGSYTMPGAPAPVPMFRLNDTRLGNTWVRIYTTGATALDAVTEVDAAQFSRDEQNLVQGAMWFDYNPSTHTVSSKGLVYIVEASNGHAVKFRIDSYDQTQQSFTISYAHYTMSTMTWGATMQATIGIADGEKLFSFAKGIIAANRWDIKLTVLSVATPIGTMSFPGVVLNRAAGVKAAMVNGTPFSDVIPASVQPLLEDGDSTFVIGTECLKYDENSHRLAPYDNRSFVVQTTAARRVKFQLNSYYNNSGASGFMAIEYVKP